MMSCDQDRGKLAAYLDGELAANESKTLQQHLRACPDCAAEIAAMVSLRRAMKPAASRFTASAQFRQKVREQVSPSKRIRMQWMWPLAAAALAVMVVALVWSRQSSLRGDTFREVADLHISDLASANPYDVVSSDRHTVKPWFQGRIPFAFNLPEFGGSDLTLLGGRMVYVHQQPAAQVVVGARQHKISVLILQETSALGAALSLSGGVAVRDSFNVETWEQHGLRFFVIGDADKAAIQQLAQSLRSANQ
ncbi:MAG TPA: zf-HC2 domain-containing protein [Terracidiphilus sp.]|jgi:anti-sigma factor RsiW